MNTENMKNMVVLKNLPSNIVEEAIVVLKNNEVVKDRELIENGANKKVKKNKKQQI